MQSGGDRFESVSFLRRDLVLLSVLNTKLKAGSDLVRLGRGGGRVLIGGNRA
jgi:hypothetical protein